MNEIHRTSSYVINSLNPFRLFLSLKVNMSLRYSHRYISPDDEARLEISCSDACDAVERLNLAKTIIMAIDLAKQSQRVGEG